MKDDQSLKTAKANKKRAAKRQRRSLRRKSQKQQKQKRSQPRFQNENAAWRQKQDQGLQLKKQATPCGNFAFCEKFQNQMAEAHRIWQNCYDSANNLMYTQQINYWRERASFLERENEELRARIADQDEKNEARYVRECQHYTPGPRFDADTKVIGKPLEFEMGNVSESYLQFMEVARRHREELLKNRDDELQQPNIKIEKF